ncbi:MAG TPA: hypothetical protein VIH42_09980 [Thermoguttaceae bacterium]
MIEDVAGNYKLNAKHIFSLSWSSGGPAGYACSLTNKKLTGAFIAMSVFKPGNLPPLENAKGHAYYIYHSPQDRICPVRMAEQAVKELEKNGAKVKMVTYEGDHGWREAVFDDINAGIEWLEENHAVEPGKQ